VSGVVLVSNNSNIAAGSYGGEKIGVAGLIECGVVGPMVPHGDPWRPMGPWGSMVPGALWALWIHGAHGPIGPAGGLAFFSFLRWQVRLKRTLPYTCFKYMYIERSINSKEGHANTVPIYSNAMDRTWGCGLRWRPVVVSIKFKCMHVVLVCHCLAFKVHIYEASLI